MCCVFSTSIEVKMHFYLLHGFVIRLLLNTYTQKWSQTNCKSYEAIIHHPIESSIATHCPAACHSFPRVTWLFQHRVASNVSYEQFAWTWSKAVVLCMFIICPDVVQSVWKKQKTILLHLRDGKKNRQETGLYQWLQGSLIFWEQLDFP